MLRRQLDDALAEIRRLTTATAMPRGAAVEAAADIVDLTVDSFLRGLPMAGVRSRVEARLRAELATMRGHAGSAPDVAETAAKIFDLAIAGAEGDDDQQTIRAIARVLAGLARPAAIVAVLKIGGHEFHLFERREDVAAFRPTPQMAEGGKAAWWEGYPMDLGPVNGWSWHPAGQ